MFSFLKTLFVKPREKYNTRLVPSRDQETDANLFARALLIPREWFLKAVEEGKTPMEIAHICNVELKHVVRRYEDLGLKSPREMGPQIRLSYGCTGSDLSA